MVKKSLKDPKPRRELKKEWVGEIAAVIGIIAFIPLVWHVTSKKTTYSLHYAWLIIKIFAAVLWLVYGITNDLPPNITGSVAAIIILTYLLFIKIYYESSGQSIHQSIEGYLSPQQLN